MAEIANDPWIEDELLYQKFWHLSVLACLKKGDRKFGNSLAKHSCPK
jgi:hypothetical protein